MKRILKTTLIAAAMALSLSSPLMAAEVASVTEARQEAARQLATLVNDAAFNEALQNHLHKNRATLADVLRDYQPKDAKSGDAVKDELRDLDRQAIRYRGLDGAIHGLLNVRMSGTNGQPPADTRGLWTATIVKNPETRRKELVAYDDRGAEHRYSADAAPDVPMLVVQSTSPEALRAGVQIMNESLRREGLQSEAPKAMSRGMAQATAREDVSVLTDIWLKNDGEQMGFDADMFAIVSGVSPDGKVEVVNVDMPWLDKDNHWYQPGQDLITWRNFGANYVNLQIFEEDTEINFKELTKAIISAVGDVSLVVAPGAPYAVVAAALAKIANKVIEAMPDGFFTNPPEYIDSFYMLERDSHYTRENPRIGARGWAKIGLMPRTFGNADPKASLDKSTDAGKPEKLNL